MEDTNLNITKNNATFCEIWVCSFIFITQHVYCLDVEDILGGGWDLDIETTVGNIKIEKAGQTSNHNQG